MVMPGEYDAASDLVKKLAYEESSCADAGYLLRLTSEIVAGVVAADRGKVPVQLGFGFGHEDKVAFNRRLRMKNGQSWSHPGAGNPDILEYAGPIDPQVGVIGAWDMQGQLVGCRGELRLPRHDQSRRHFGQLDSIPRKNHPGRPRHARTHRLHAGRVR
jgi:neutral ceramidase